MAGQHVDVFRARQNDNLAAGGEAVATAPDREAVAGHGCPARLFHAPRQEIAGADEVGHELVGRLAVDLKRRADLLDLGVAHDDDQVGHGHGLALVVGDDDGGDAQSLLQLAKFDLHRFTQIGIQRRQGLVEQEYVRLERQGAGDGDPLALAAGKLRDVAVGNAR